MLVVKSTTRSSRHGESNYNAPTRRGDEPWRANSLDWSAYFDLLPATRGVAGRLLSDYVEIQVEMPGSNTATDGVTEPTHETSKGHHDHRSRWPVIAAFGAAILYFGAGLWFLARTTGVAPTLLGIVLTGVGVVGIVVGLVGWTYDGFLKSYWQQHDQRDRYQTYRATMILFLVTDVATFSAGFVYYFFIRVGTWPPAELPTLLGSLVLLNTGILVSSSFTLHFAHVFLERDNRAGFLGLLGVTLLLGIIFLGGQALEYYEFIVAEGFGITTGVFASAFYGLTGLHGLHVALGVVFLFIVFGRALRGQYTADRDTSVTTASLYWHFVDVVWLFLVAVLYVGAELGS